MKTVLGNLTILVAACLIGSAAHATNVGTPGIVGSKHDFSLLGLDNSSGLGVDEICIYCHAPHNVAGFDETVPTGTVLNPGGTVTNPDGTTTTTAPSTSPNTTPTLIVTAPLWNRQMSTANYTVFSRRTSTGGLTKVGLAPNGSSKMCLSCHDGTIAVDSYGGNTGGHFITGDANLGTDMRNDHPVSVNYISAYNSSIVAGRTSFRAVTEPVLVASGNALVAATSSTVGTSGTPVMTVSRMLDTAGNLQCTGCNQVHNSYGIDKLLRMNNKKSALCLSCHNK